MRGIQNFLRIFLVTCVVIMSPSYNLLVVQVVLTWNVSVETAFQTLKIGDTQGRMSFYSTSC